MTSQESEHLSADEIAYLEQVFVSIADDWQKPRVSVAQALECLEQMDFLVTGESADLIRAVVPASATADSLDLQDVIKVASLVKAKDTAPSASYLDRDDSLVELENSFKSQMAAGQSDLKETNLFNRDDSLMELENSFKSQMAAGQIPDTVAEEVEAPKSPVGPLTSATGFASITPSDAPVMRRRSIAVTVPTLSLVPGPSPPRSESLKVFQREYASLEGPEPKQVDVPQRRSSLNTRPGNSALIDAPNIVPTNFEDSPLPLSQQELAKQESEAELLASVGGLSAELVTESDLPVKRRSVCLTPARGYDGLSDGGSEEPVDAEEIKQQLAEAEAEAIRQSEAVREAKENARVRAEVEAALEGLRSAVERDAALTLAAEKAERRATEAAVHLAGLESARIRAEVESVLTSMMDLLEHEVAISRATQEAESRAAEAAAAAAVEMEVRVSEELNARLAAEVEAAKNAQRAEEALRLVAIAEDQAQKREAQLVAATKAAEAERLALLQAEDDSRSKAEAEAKEQQAEGERIAVERLALEEEMWDLRSQLQEAGEEAKERAREDAEAQAVASAVALEEEKAKVEREKMVMAGATEKVEREGKARAHAEKEAKEWKEKFEAMQREEEVREGKATVAAAVEEARKFEEKKARNIKAAREEGSTETEMNVDYESIGGNWWQCLTCTTNVRDQNQSQPKTLADRTDFCGGVHDVGVSQDNDEDIDDDYVAAVSKVKRENWKSSSARSIGSKKSLKSNRSNRDKESRPKDGDVCSVM